MAAPSYVLVLGFLQWKQCIFHSKVNTQLPEWKIKADPYFLNCFMMWILCSTVAFDGKYSLVFVCLFFALLMLK